MLFSEPTSADKGTQTEPADFNSLLNGQMCQINDKDQNNPKEKPIDKGNMKTENKTFKLKDSHNEIEIAHLQEKHNNIKPPNHEIIVDKNNKGSATNDKADTL